MIFKEIEQKPLEYIALAILLCAGVVLYFVCSFDPHAQRRVIYAITDAYLFWSLFHHYRRGDLQTSIVIEYLVIALFAILLISGTLL